MSNIKQVLGKEDFAKFLQWMNGQTTTVYKNGDSLFIKGLPVTERIF